jgi:hypothetical protein
LTEAGTIAFTCGIAAGDVVELDVLVLGELDELDELLLPHAATAPAVSRETAKISQLLGLRIAPPVVLGIAAEDMREAAARK